MLVASVPVDNTIDYDGFVGEDDDDDGDGDKIRKIKPPEKKDTSYENKITGLSNNKIKAFYFLINFFPDEDWYKINANKTTKETFYYPCDKKSELYELQRSFISHNRGYWQDVTANSSK
jgi:hypothetical protein